MLLQIVFLALAAVVIPTSLVLFLECVAAWFYRDRSAPGGQRPSLGVLLPAHDEELGIARTVLSILPQLHQADRLLVIADNCADRTAEFARQAGGTVLERHDPTLRGKGYALAAGVDAWRASPPDVVVFIDADTPIEPGTLEALAAGVQRSGRPNQVVYLLNPPESPSSRDLISTFAFRVRNLVRPLGQSVLGIPCPLMGTGMAIPWKPLTQLNLASGNLVEDMQLGIDLTLLGYAPQFNSLGRVHGVFPSAASAAADQQRRRWEHGHLLTIVRQVPRILWAACRQRRLSLLGFALALAVPPLALLVSLLAALVLTAISLSLLAQVIWPCVVTAVPAVMLAVAVLISWLRFASDIPITAILFVPFYVLRKLPMYAAFIWNRQQAWVRTER